MIEGFEEIGATRRELLGYEVVSSDKDAGVVATWRPSRDMANPVGQAHGGMVGALVDDMCGLALIASLERIAAIPTINLNIDFYRPAWVDQEYTARSRTLKLGKRVAFCEMTVENAEGQLLLRGTCSFAMS